MERLWGFRIRVKQKKKNQAQNAHRLFVELQPFCEQGRRHRLDSHSLRGRRRLRKVEPPLLDHFARPSTGHVGSRDVLILHREALTYTWARVERKHVR